MVIGIDPDLRKSGVAIVEGGKYTLLKTMCHVELFNFIKDLDITKSFVILEAGWLNKKSNWHSAKGGMRIAKNVGENHAAGKIIEMFLEYYKVPYRLKIPKTSKLSSAMFAKITGKVIKNQDIIDAAMLIYEHIR